MAIPAQVAVPLLMWIRWWLSLLQDLVTWQSVVVGVVVAIATRLWCRPRPHLPPGPPPSPFVGNLFALRSSKTQDPLYSTFDAWRREYGPIFTIYTGFTPIVIINSKAEVQEMFAKNGAKCLSRFQPGWDLHFNTRQSLNGDLRNLTSKSIKKMIQDGTFEECVTSSLDSVIARIRNKGDAPFDPQPFMTYLSLDIAHALFFSQRLQPEDYQEFLGAHVHLNEALEQMFLETLTTFSGVFEPSARQREVSAAQREMFEIVRAKIVDRMNKHSYSGTPHDLITHTLHAKAMQLDRDMWKDSTGGRQIIDDQTVEYSCNLLRGTIDSCRLPLLWTLLYLCDTPEIQQECQKEIDTHLDGHAPGLEDCARLPFTAAVLEEVIRLRPPHPLDTPCFATCDTVLGGFDIPQGTTILLNNWTINKDPGTWTDPATFQPKRFLELRGKSSMKRNPSRAQLSSGGSQSLGEDATRLQLLLVVSSLLHNFTFTFPEGYQADLAPDDGVFWSAPNEFQVVCTPRVRRHPPIAWQGMTVDYSEIDTQASLGFSSYLENDELNHSTLLYLEGRQEKEVKLDPLSPKPPSAHSSGGWFGAQWVKVRYRENAGTENVDRTRGFQYLAKHCETESDLSSSLERTVFSVSDSSSTVELSQRHGESCDTFKPTAPTTHQSGRQC